MKIVILSLIIFLLLITTVMSFFSAQSRARDEVRVKDIALIQKFLSSYKENEGSFPPAANKLPTNWQKYLQSLPQAPEADGNCSDEDNAYQYSITNSGKSYKLAFCLGHATDAYSSGKNEIVVSL